MDASAGSVVLVNLFQLPASADAGFVAAWERARDFLAGQDGYVSTQLHQSLGPDADFRLSTWPAGDRRLPSRTLFPSRSSLAGR